MRARKKQIPIAAGAQFVLCFSVILLSRLAKPLHRFHFIFRHAFAIVPVGGPDKYIIGARLSPRQLLAY